MPYVHSQGCRIYYRLEGSGSKPLLVLVHSLGCDHGMWDLQVPALLPHFQILRLDLRGHGASDAPDAEYTISQLAEDVLAAVNREKFAYCGLSLGGMIGQWLAARSQRVQRLVLANTSPRMGDPTLFDVRRKIVLEQGMQAIEDGVMQRFFTAATLASGDPYAESIRNVILTTNPAGYAGCCSAIRDMDHRGLLAKIAVPTLIITGDQDVSTPWTGHGEVLASSIPGAVSRTLNTAHLSNIERPSEFNAALLEFLTGE